MFISNMRIIIEHTHYLLGHGCSLQLSSTVAFVPSQSIIVILPPPEQEQFAPPFNGFGLSQCFTFVFLPPPHSSLQAEKFPASFHPPFTTAIKILNG